MPYFVVGGFLSRSRIHGSEEGSKQSCTITDLGWRILCSAGLTLVCSAGFSPNAVAQGSFDFAVDAVRVDGNVDGSGAPNGASDFQDDFGDGSLTSPPTSAFHCLDPVSESGGFLNLRSADGTGPPTPPFLVDNCQLGGAPGPSVWRLIDGGGNSVIDAVFRADTPVPNSSYGLQLFTRGVPGPDEIINIQVGGNGTVAEVVALSFGVPGPSQLVSLAGVSRIGLRLSFDDSTNLVRASFSINDGASFTELSVPPGTIMVTNSEAVVSVFGAVRASPTTALPQPTYPIVFVHGLCSGDSTWDDTKKELEKRGFVFGGVLDISSSSQPMNRDFYAVNFQNRALQNGIADWTNQLETHLTTLSSLEGPGAQFILVAHSAGGLASRNYLQSSQFDSSGKVHHLITYGTPHQGSFLVDLFPLALCSPFSLFSSQGVVEMEPGSFFLNNLNAQAWDDGVLHTSLIGSSGNDSSGNPHDTVVTIDSQNMRNVGAPNHTADNQPKSPEADQRFREHSLCHQSKRPLWRRLSPHQRQFAR